jgi:hypothetical protein
MNAKDGTFPTDDLSWVDYCDALANEAWIESRKEYFPAKKPDLRADLRDDFNSARFPMST